LFAGLCYGCCYVARGPNPAGDVRCIAENSAKATPPRLTAVNWLDVAAQTLILPAMFEGEMHHLWPTLLLDTNAVSQWVDVREPLQWLSYNLLWHSMRSAACIVRHARCNGQRAHSVQHTTPLLSCRPVECVRCGAVRCFQVRESTFMSNPKIDPSEWNTVRAGPRALRST
jgi:hypothetical protein